MNSFSTTTPLQDVHYRRAFSDERDRIDCEVQDLLREVNALVSRIRSLRQRRNELEPVFRLPSDVVSRIFRLYKSAQYEDKFPSGYAYSQVCQCWRQVALNTPALWSAVPRKTVELTRTFLLRSQKTPISFSVNGRNTSQDAISAVLSHLDRIQTFDLSTTRNLVMKNSASLSQASPLLERFSMWSSDHQPDFPTIS
ncbi:hypothetical protein PUNSTDRAFT_137520 [Punctularia strigosozonata HHB-11173 SS5]|uniref:uncharacterized protein n=1 Tax=Punctularia strigosozonata (strain HHB-11173) TaxID=741275 RepID=UPI0004417BAE|nr:uncharacterized protein PUNSTDRAFT_137520 [Punctularia strigosozonata HHB-11173 SS5]EIN05408.1 hypothetical protein PUNSTDRAFT_137520 [Punctularia strigosozonata HHB-11173 SS5]